MSAPVTSRSRASPPARASNGSVSRKCAPEVEGIGSTTAVGLGDAQRDGQSETRALANILGREERLEDPSNHRRRHSGAVVLSSMATSPARSSGRTSAARRRIACSALRITFTRTAGFPRGSPSARQIVLYCSRQSTPRELVDARRHRALHELVHVDLVRVAGERRTKASRLRTMSRPTASA